MTNGSLQILLEQIEVELRIRHEQAAADSVKEAAERLNIAKFRDQREVQGTDPKNVIFLVQRLDLDPWENLARGYAYRYTNVGYTLSREIAEQWAESERIAKSCYPWPLQLASEFQGETDDVPRYRVIAVEEIHAPMSHESVSFVR